MTAEFTRTLALGDVPGWYEPLSLALVQAGASADSVQLVIGQALSLHCIQCGAAVSGSSFIALGLPSLEAIANAAELQRLSQRHCVTENCPSCFCQLRFSRAQGFNWESVWSAAERIRERARTKANRVQEHWWQSLLQKRKAGPSATVALVLLVLIGVVYWRLRTPFWAKPVPVYWADTNVVSRPIPAL
jgi:hypothetical protein